MNEQLVQLCVDGELTPIEQRRFLSSLADGDASWKQLACLLLEDRVLADACRDWLEEGRPAPDASPSWIEEESAAAETASRNGHSRAFETHRSHVGIRLETSIEQRREQSRHSNRIRWIMPSCVALVGIAFGVWLGSQLPRGIDSDVLPGESSLAHAPRDPEASSRTDLDDGSDVPSAPAFDTIQLTVTTPDGPQVIEVPVVGANDLQRLVSVGSSISPEVREQLSRQGIQLNESPGVITLPIDDAHHVMVPVQAVQMRHVGF